LHPKQRIILHMAELVIAAPILGLGIAICIGLMIGISIRRRRRG